MEQRLTYGAEVDAVNRWLFDAEAGAILACIQVASAGPVHVAIRVRNPRDRCRARGEFAISCLGTAADCWRVEHGVFDGHLGPPHPLLPDLTLLLTNAPEPVGRMLARL